MRHRYYIRDLRALGELQDGKDDIASALLGCIRRLQADPSARPYLDVVEVEWKDGELEGMRTVWPPSP